MSFSDVGVDADLLRKHSNYVHGAGKDVRLIRQQRFLLAF
jgi:hypothetical protein